jgi:hypothetical protein
MLTPSSSGATPIKRNSGSLICMCRDGFILRHDGLVGYALATRLPRRPLTLLPAAPRNDKIC